MAETYPREPMGAIPDSSPYELAIRSKAGAEKRLGELGALDEIEQAVLAARLVRIPALLHARREKPMDQLYVRHLLPRHARPAPSDGCTRTDCDTPSRRPRP